MKTTMRYYFTPIRTLAKEKKITNVGKNIEKLSWVQ